LVIVIGQDGDKKYYAPNPDAVKDAVEKDNLVKKLQDELDAKDDEISRAKDAAEKAARNAEVAEASQPQIRHAEYAEQDESSLLEMYYEAQRQRHAGRYDTALELVQNVAASGRFAGKDMLYCELGTIHLLMGNIPEAKAAFELSFRHDPQPDIKKVADHNLGYILERLNDARAKEFAVLKEENGKFVFYKMPTAGAAQREAA
jgi:hypothetical protein